MAISVIQSAQNGTFTSSVTVSISPSTSGSFILVCPLYASASVSPSVTSITDNAGNTYTRITGTSGVPSFPVTDFWYSNNSFAGATSVVINVTPGSGGFTEALVVEFSGVSTTSPIGTSGEYSDGSDPTPRDGPSLTISNASDLLVCTGIDTAVNAPWSVIQSISSPASFLVTKYAPGTPGTYNAVFPNNSSQFVSCAVALQANSTHTITISDSMTETDTFNFTDVKNIQDIYETETINDTVKAAVILNPQDELLLNEWLNITTIQANQWTNYNGEMNA
jgi:hypothetical protein